jgi:hypothetical protein
MYTQAIKWYQKFLDEGQGWVEDNIEACGKMADCYINLQKWQNAIDSSMRSFNYDSPRGENC